jgi:Ca2+-binding EF-hand superfamily protein
MKISRTRLKEIIKGVMTEENEYQAFFQTALDKAGKSIPSMSDDEKKAFFDKIDAAWNGKGEKNEELVGGQKKLDTDKDGEIEASDLAKLRASKNESLKEENPGLWANIRAKQDRGEKPAHGNSDAHKDAVKAAKSINKGESVNEEEINWNATENAIINFLKMNTKILDKRVKDRDVNGVKGGLQSIIDGLTNAQRSLKLK